jgi:DNA-binding LacI/PurR family transcriptional regulator
MANIKDIARLAGVSASTVSRVINQSGYVNENTRITIEKIMKQLDYVPNRNAVSLKTGRTGFLGIVAPYFNDSMNLLLSHFTMAAQKNGYNISLFMTLNDKNKEIQAFEMLRRKQIDAVLLLIRLNDWSVIEQYAKYGPVVTWQRLDSKIIHSVYMNQYDGYTLALEHLYKTGKRKIVNLYGSMKGLNTRSRIKAYEDFCARYDIYYDKNFHGLSTVKDGEKIAEWWLKQKEKPDAFATLNDSVAAGLFTKAKEYGIDIPGDFSITGFDNIEISRLLKLTTIHYPIDLQARNAFIIIDNLLNNKNTSLFPLSFHLVERKST